jgi:hypothetical protein
MYIFALTNFADMVKLVDMPDLGSGAARRVGSSPIIRTFKIYKTLKTNVLRVFSFYFCRHFADNNLFFMLFLVVFPPF